MKHRTISIRERPRETSCPDFEVQLASNLMNESPVVVDWEVHDLVSTRTGRDEGPIGLVRGAVRAQMRSHDGDTRSLDE